MYMMSFRTLSTSALLAFGLTACGVDTTGLSAESSRRPTGVPNASVVVVEFADLQCPACKGAHELITGPLLEKYGNRIRFEFKHFPLSAIHIHAMEAAMAAECAADQGKFWEFIDIDYTNQEKLSSSELRVWGKELGLDEALFDRCIASGIKKKTVLADYAEGEKKGVNSTPTFFINGTRVNLVNVGDLEAAVDAALAASAAVPL